MDAERLPIDEVLPQVLAGIATGSVVLRAPPGAGKTTRVPPALLEQLTDGRRMILVQPRRLAARTAARRIAQQLGCRVGDDVGYAVRFDSQFCDRTRILVVTDGVLLRMMQDDPLLEQVDIVIFDEFHERSLQIDLAFAMACRVQNVGEQLRIVVMSATLAPEPIAKFLNDCRVVESAGRQYPVDIQFASRPEPRKIVDSAVHGIEKMLGSSTGDLLVFLPGVGEIRQVERQLTEPLSRQGIVVQTLYGNMPPEQQDAVIHKQSSRRVILSTNVAETSVTIDGIEAVVDSGWVRQMSYDPSVGLDRLELTPISKASADQRAGRAGRLGPGKCLRLWEKSRHASRPEFDVPEIARADLSAATLQLLCWGESDVASFPWFEKPSTESLDAAFEVLRTLGAWNGKSVSPLGRTMGRLPLAPRLARLVLEGYRRGALRRAAIAAAMLSERDPFEMVQQKTIRGNSGGQNVVESDSDIVDRVEALEEFQRSGKSESAFGRIRIGAARFLFQAADQFQSAVENLLGPCDEADDPELQAEGLMRALLVAYADRLARRRGSRDPRGVLGKGKGVCLDRSSRVVDGEFFVCVDVDGRKSVATVRQASLVRREWLEDSGAREEEELFFHPTQKRVVARRNRYWGGLLLEEKTLPLQPNEESALLLHRMAVASWSQVFPQNDRVLNETLQRERWLRTTLEQGDTLPSWEECDLQQLLLPFCYSCLSFADLKKTDWNGLLLSQLTYEQRTLLDEAAPETITVPSGRRVRLRYRDNAPPILEARIQEMFGLAETPRVANGRVLVLLHLLAPNNRPQQVTDDLASFWENTYPQVRKELRGRYPKHPWPEDPLSASAKKR